MRQARRHHAERRRLIARMQAVALDLWKQLDPDFLDLSWRLDVANALVTAVITGQIAAAAQANPYLDRALRAQGIDPDGYRVNPRAFGGTASDERSLGSLLQRPLVRVKVMIGHGVKLPEALAAGGRNLSMIVGTQIADAGRFADQAGLIGRPGVSGYIRQTDANPCSRCEVLSGRWYRWSSGFARHPNCDCVHVPGNPSSLGFESSGDGSAVNGVSLPGGIEALWVGRSRTEATTLLRAGRFLI